MSPEVSIVIPVRNGEEVLGQCLEAVTQQSLEPGSFEVIVVDDGSSDQTTRIARNYGVRLFSQPPSGASSARNLGVEHAQSHVVLFTDADCAPDRHWAETLSRPLLESKAQGAVGRCFSEQAQWVAALTQIELDERYARMLGQRRIDFLNTGNCAFLKSVLGWRPFDENFRWLEDVELSFRLAQAGCEMHFISDARVRHIHPQSFWIYLRRKFRYATYTALLCRLYPEKTISDSRTPSSRRLQLVLLTLATLAGLAALPGWIGYFPGTTLFLLSILCSYPFVLRASRHSVRLGTLAPGFVLLANVAFVLGTIRGLFSSLMGAAQRRRDTLNRSGG